MREYIVRRLVRLIVTFVVVLVLNFFIPRAMPGNPANILANENQLPPETAKQLIKLFKLDEPIWNQFIAYIINTFQGNWGISYRYYPTTVYELLMQRLPWTIFLLGISTITTALLGMFLGIIAGWKRGSKIDSTISISSMFIWAIPYYWLAMMLVYVFGYILRLTPISQALTPGAEYSSFFDFALDALYHAILPISAITLTAFATYTLLTRNTMLDVLTEDFVTVAKAKGLPERVVMIKHVLRNALLPPITILSLRFGFIVGGAIFTETVFSYPGVGLLIYESIIYHDYPVLQGAFFLLSITVILANLVADIVYVLLDPRVRYG